MKPSTSGSQSADDGALAPDLYDYDFENDPIATLNRLRAEDPVHWSRHGFWYLTRYADCAAVLKDPVRFSSMAAGWGGENPLAQAKTTGAQSGAEKGLSRTLALVLRSNQMERPRPQPHPRPGDVGVLQAEHRGARATHPGGDRRAAGRGCGEARARPDHRLRLPPADHRRERDHRHPGGRPRAVPRGVRANRGADGAQALGGVVGGGAGSRARGRPLRARPDRAAPGRAAR